MSEQKMHTHKRRVGKGHESLKQRRAIALITLEQVEKPNERQQAEIKILQKRVGHA